MKLDRGMLRQFLNLIAILAAFAVNVLSNVASPSGFTIGGIANTFFSKVLIVPANYAFAIWGLIYLGLFTFGVYQALPAQRQSPILDRIGYLFVLASLAQISWVFLFTYQLLPLSLVAMLGILLSLIGIYLRLGIGSRRISQQEKWFVHIPFSIYLAWISVATIVNVTLTLYDLNWDGRGISSEVWTVIMLIVGGAIAATLVIQRTDIAYTLVIIWAFVAIAVRQADRLPIAGTAGGLAIALILLLFFVVLRRRQSSMKLQ